MANENVIDRKAVKMILRDEKEYSVLPITLNALIKVLPIIKKLENKRQEVDESLINDIKAIAKVALKDQLEKDADVGDLVDMQDIQKIIAAIMGQNEDTVKAMIQAQSNV